MSDLISFFEEKAKESSVKREGTGTSRPSTYLGKLILSEEDENYVFSIIDIGVQIYSHDQKFPNKPKLCLKKYYDEECPDCEQLSGFKNKRKVKDEDGNEVEIEIEAKKTPKRKLHAFCYLHNFTGASKKKKDSDETYQPNPEFVSDWPCGEANTQSKLERDRNIKNILNVKDLGCLDSTVFMTKRSPGINARTGKKSSITQFPVTLPEKAKITYKIPGVGEVTNLVSKLVVPDDIIKKYENMTVQEKYGLILATQFDQSTVNRPFFENLGVVFPPEPEKTKESVESTSSLSEE